MLCQCYSLGTPLAPPEVLTGGFHHRMWGLSTNEGRFAVKQLAADLDVHSAGTLQRFELTEAAARQFSNHGIPAVAALQLEERFVRVIGSSAYLVYPRVEAIALHRDAIGRSHGARVAEIFAAMHQARVTIPGLPDENYSVMDAARLETLVQFAHSRNASRSAELEGRLPVFLGWIDKQSKAAAFLSSNTVVSHGDLDHKNVLWSASGEAFVIDWESARWLNPTHEIVLEALDWSGITLDFNEQLFDHIVSVYLKSGGTGEFDEVEAALDCVLGDWLNWLMYNLGRSIDMDHEEQRRIGSEQVDHALATLLRLERLVPRLLAKIK